MTAQHFMKDVSFGLEWASQADHGATETDHRGGGVGVVEAT